MSVTTGVERLKSLQSEKQTEPEGQKANPRRMLVAV